MEDRIWHLYILRCKGDKLYTGIAVDVQKRFEAHCSGKGANIHGVGDRYPWNTRRYVGPTLRR